MQFYDSIDRMESLELGFINALISKGRNALLDSLSDKGVFEIQNRKLEIIEVGKHEFVNWIFEEREKVKTISSYLDKCTGCKKGCPIIMFNYGRFPVKPHDASEYEKSGFSLTVEDDKIVKIEFCRNFKNTKNTFVFMDNIEKKLRTYMRRNNCTKSQAERDLRENFYLYLDL